MRWVAHQWVPTTDQFVRTMIQGAATLRGPSHYSRPLGEVEYTYCFFGVRSKKIHLLCCTPIFSGVGVVLKQQNEIKTHKREVRGNASISLSVRPSLSPSVSPSQPFKPLYIRSEAPKCICARRALGSSGRRPC